MALGDEIEVLYDAGGTKAASETVRANSAGGSVTVAFSDRGATVKELTRAGNVRRSVNVPMARVVAIIERPKG